MNLQKQLRFYLHKNAITAAELSRRSEVAKQSISDWLAGVHPRSIPHVKKVATVLGISLDELCFGDGINHQIAKELTEHEASLKFQNKDNNVIFPSQPTKQEMLCFIGYDGYVKYVNPLLPGLLDWSVEEFKSRPMSEFFHLHERKRMRIAMKLHSGQGGTISDLDVRILTRDGGVKYIRLNGVLSSYDQLVICAIKDVTDDYLPESRSMLKFPVCELIQESFSHRRLSVQHEKNTFELRTEPEGFSPLLYCYPSEVASLVSAMLDHLANRKERARLLLTQRDQNLVLRFYWDEGDEMSAWDPEEMRVPFYWLEKHRGHAEINVMERAYDLYFPLTV